MVELHCEDPGAPPRRLTRDGAAWQRALSGVAHEQVSIPGPAGPIRATLAAPRGAGRRMLPLVLSIIGGPGASWGPEPWLPDRALTGAGTRMLMPDPRGSGSYGRAWLEAIRGDWGGADAEDQLACVDWAVGEGLADPARLGVTGLSYGGFMTHWLIGQDDRFRAAVAANGVSNQISSVANCDLGTLWTPRLGWGRPPADCDRLWQQSPLAHADRVTTPLLMLQGEADLRCPAADNEQLFAALRALGRPVEYVLYPEESHLMQATGRPDRRIDMLERTERWFRAHGVLDPAPRALAGAFVRSGRSFRPPALTPRRAPGGGAPPPVPSNRAPRPPLAAGRPRPSRFWGSGGGTDAVGVVRDGQDGDPTSACERFVTLCAPSGPGGKQTRSPGPSSCSPSGSRRLGVPVRTSSHSSSTHS